MTTSQWTARNSDVLQIAPVDGFLAVYADEHSVAPAVTLFTVPLVALGVAEVTFRTYEGVAGKGSRVVKESTETQIVGITLEGGGFHVANDDDNFAGICRVGDDPYTATEDLPAKYFGGLERPKPPSPLTAAASLRHNTSNDD